MNTLEVIESVRNWLKSHRIKIATTEYDYVFGSRKVIKDPNNPYQQHYYKDENGNGFDLWTREGLKYAHLIPKNVVLYGELIGWTSEGSPIQANYTYDVPNGQAHLYIYRVAFVSEDGGLYDLSWEGVKEFCAARGLDTVRELWHGLHSEFIAEDWLDWNYSTYYPNAIPLAKDSPCDEGVVIRMEGVLPTVLKAKSPVFLNHETKLLDKEVVDIEAEEA